MKRARGIAQKGVSAIVSAAMVLLLVPTIPLAMADNGGAQETPINVLVGADDSSYGFPKTIIYNNAANPAAPADPIEGNPSITVGIATDKLPAGAEDADLGNNVDQNLLQAAASDFIGNDINSEIIKGAANEKAQEWYLTHQPGFTSAVREQIFASLTADKPANANAINVTIPADFSVSAAISAGTLETPSTSAANQPSYIYESPKWISGDVTDITVTSNNENALSIAAFNKDNAKAELQTKGAGDVTITVGYSDKSALTEFSFEGTNARICDYKVVTGAAINYSYTDTNNIEHTGTLDSGATIENAGENDAPLNINGTCTKVTGIKLMNSKMNLSATTQVTVDKLFTSFSNETAKKSFKTLEPASIPTNEILGQSTAKPDWAQQLLKDPVISTVTPNTLINPSYDGGSLSLEVYKKLETEEKATVEFKLPDDQKFTLTIPYIVNASEKLANWVISNNNGVSYDGCFRLKEDTEAELLNNINSYLKNVVSKGVEGNRPETNFFTGLTFTNYDETGGSKQTQNFTLTENPNLGAEWDSFESQIKKDGVVTVNAIEQKPWSGDPDLKLTPAYKDTGWYNASTGSPKVKYVTDEKAGAGVAYGTTNVPTSDKAFYDEVELNFGDGIHKANVYVRNNSSGIIHEVIGVEYKLDTLAPKLVSWDVDEAKAAEGSNIFEKGLFARDKIGVNLYIADVFNGSDSHAADNGSVESVASGVVEVTSEFNDGNKKNENTKKNESPKTEMTNYPFEIKGDVEVKAEDIRVTAVDYAGNKVEKLASEFDTIPSDVALLVADASVPTMSYSWDNEASANGSYFKANRTLSVHIDDNYFAKYTKVYAGDQLVCSIAGSNGEKVDVHLTDFNDEGNFSYSFTSDADYTVTWSTWNDLVGRAVQGLPGNMEFTIDKTAPSMSPSFDNNDVTNGKYYKAGRTATIVVTEHNFNPELLTIRTNGALGSWATQGDTHTLTISFATDGIYYLDISGMDLATNPFGSWSSGEFVIDLTAPVIEISGVGNSAYGPGTDATPAVHVNDTNIDASTTTIGAGGAPEKVSDLDSNNNPYSPSVTNTATDINASYTSADSTRDNDGIYTLSVNAQDLAGNTANQSVTWSVNRFGSTFYVEKGADMLNGWTNDPQDLTVVEVNPSGISDYSVYLSKDNKTNELTAQDVNVTSNSRGSNWYTNTYAFNKGLYAEDGSYSVLISSRDGASNTNVTDEAERLQTDEGRTRGVINFGVDTQEPTITVLNADKPENGKVKVRVEDNGVIDTVNYIERGSNGSPQAAEQSGEDPNIYLVGADGSYDIDVIATDKAGNSSAALVSNATTIIAIVLGVAAVIVIAAVAFFLVRRKRANASSGRLRI